VLKTDAWERLRDFRQALYDNLGLRQDSLFELVDAALTASHRSTLVRLSLTAAFRRRWASTCDALADGSIDAPALRTAFARELPETEEATLERRAVWAIDGTHWPRPAARASAHRTWEYRPLPGWPQTGVVPAWAYQWLVAVPEVSGSWVLPLDVQRRGPTAKSATTVALEQIADVRTAQPAGTPRPVVTLDSGYDLETLARASVDADLLVRLVKNRVLYRPPLRRPGRGRPRLHGTPFRLTDKRTHGKPRQSAHLDHPLYGKVQIDLWSDLHVRGASHAPFSVIRVQVERLPRMRQKPYPLWLAWIGGPLPADLTSLWHWYLRRFTIEHAFRFLKQTLGWTTVRPRHAEAADRWSWLIASACWQLWLARPIVSDIRLPWEQARPGRSTPGHVQRHFTGILLRVGTPARAPQTRGKSPGRPVGHHPKPPFHYQVVRRAPPRAA
jgi:DDE family transposase